MPRLRDHGIGMKKKSGLSSSILKEISSATGVSKFQGNDPYVRALDETKSYYWYHYTVGSTNVLVRKSKADSTDVKFLTTTYDIKGVTAIYDADQVVLLTSSTDSIYVINASMAQIGTLGFTLADWILGSYYHAATKVLYVVTMWWSNDYFHTQFTLTAINLTTPTAPTTVYSVRLFNVGTNTQEGNVVVAFDPATAIFRIQVSGSENKRFTLSNGALFSTDTIAAHLYGDTVCGIDFDTVIQIDSQGIIKRSLNTNSVILQKTLATLRSELAPYVKDTSLVMDGNPMTYCGKTSSGNYLGLMGFNRTNGGSYYLLFTFNESFQIIKAEPDFGFRNSVNMQNAGARKIFPQKTFTVSSYVEDAASIYVL